MDNPLTLNRYTYVHNNPLRYWDPTGHNAWDDFKKGWSNFTDPNAWNRSWEKAKADLPKGLIKFTQEQIGVENFQVLTDGYWTVGDVSALAWAGGELLVGRLKIVRNAHLAGKIHPKTGVKFDSKGFPIFESKFDMTLSDNLLSAGDTTQFKAATKSLWEAIQKNPSLKQQFTPKQLEQIKNGAAKIEGYTWHHHQDVGRMQLVDETIHSQTGHTGGKYIWGGGR